ncbi:MAG: 1-acyl-sn-glycerol-3-phosphate acyltransferase [Lachnospiraceae bacterium]|nr:1-acyl-sn-glycerol-3-phosphate acyltransferase [Lachnospiraceae bacterium]
MKIKVRPMEYEQVLRRPKPRHRRPVRPSRVLGAVVRLASRGELRKVNFTWEQEGMEKIGEKEPCLILMNHSSFIDLKIAATVFARRPYQIVCTTDGFVGKAGLMHRLGCIPTQKFVTDSTLVRDMIYCVRKLKTSILLFPEAGYSFDGTATTLPDSLGKLIRMLGVPVIFAETRGAFTRDPLYNDLQIRNVPVSAKVRCLLTAQEAAQKDPEEINALVRKAFSFDQFRWQQENHIRVKESFRADHLNRVLYKCPHCRTEGRMTGRGTTLTCGACGKTWELTEYGEMQALQGVTEFGHIPDWYAWERACVRKEIEAGTYRLDTAVDILMLVDTKALYRIGSGRLTHDADGIRLVGAGGKLDYRQRPEMSYSLNADYYWYELGDVISIGDSRALYYCFPQEGGDVVAKARLAAEEMYKLRREEKA